MEDELRRSNKELLQTLKIGQKKAWDILNDDKLKRKENKEQLAKCRAKAQYTCSTPTTAPYLTLLEKAGNTRQLDGTLPLTSLDNTSLNSSTYGRPHKTPTRANRPLLNCSDSTGPHSPLCSENHRDKLNQELNNSYSQLAEDLRRLAPYCTTDMVGGISESSSLSIKPESYYDEMRKFRLANSAECSVKLPHEKTVIAKLEETLNSIEELKSTIEEPHQCIQTYTVGPGYRADDHSCDQCPLCAGADDTKLRGLIRVNIPQKDEVKYTRKLNFNPDSLDSLGLSKHCSAGWEQSRSQYKVKSIPSFGYKDALTE